MDVRHVRTPFKCGGNPYELAIVYAGKHRIEISESPSGRSVQVWVGDERVYPQATTEGGAS